MARIEGRGGNVDGVAIDVASIRRAAESISNLVIGPAPSRTNPGGDVRRVADPRGVLSRELVTLVGTCLQSIRDLTPAKSGKVRDSYNVRSSFAGVQSKGTFTFAEWEIASDLPDSEQVVVNALETGSTPHVIRARNATFMRIPLDERDVSDSSPKGGDGGGVAFVVEEEGQKVLYATRVSHPGTQPHAMFAKTLDASIPLADALARRVVEEVLKTWGRRER